MSSRSPLSLPVVVTITEGGKSRTLEYDGASSLTIGRSDDNTIVLTTDRASRQHCEIIGEGGLFTLLDRKSSNGTIVDGEKTKKAPLSAGSVIEIGPVKITFGEKVGGRVAPGRRGAPARAGSSKPVVTSPAKAAPSSKSSAPSTSGTSPKPAAVGASAASSSPPAAPPRRSAVAQTRTPVAQRAAAAIIGVIAVLGIGWTLKELTKPEEQTPLAQNEAPANASSNANQTSSDRAQPVPSRSRDQGAPRGAVSETTEWTPPPPIERNETPSGVDDWEEDRTPSKERGSDRSSMEDWLKENEALGVGESDDKPSVDLTVDFEQPTVEQVQPPVEERPVIAIIPDAWPPGARTIGYEYNQKNHNATPGFVERGGDSMPERNAARYAKSYRVIGVELNPEKLPPGAKVRLRSAQLRDGKKIPLTLPEEISERYRKYFVVEAPEDRRIVVELLEEDGRTPISSAETILPERGGATPLVAAAEAIRDERQREEWERSQLSTREVTIEVRDDRGRVVPDARVLLLREAGSLLTFEGVTDENGIYRRSVVPGSYAVLVHAEVPDIQDPDASTVVRLMPRLLSLQGRLAADETELKFAPERSVLVRILDEGETPLPIESIWVTPGPIAEAYRYERVAREIGRRGRLESDREAPGGLHLILGREPVELGVLGRTGDGEPVLITERVTPQKDECVWAFRRNRFAKLTFDPARATGGVTNISGEVVAVSRFRERFPIRTDNGPWTAYVMPGKYRIACAAELPEGNAQFLPYAIEIPSGATHDLTPRAPWDLTLYQKRKDRQQQFWLAVADAGGKILVRPPGEPGRIVGKSGSEIKVDQELARFSWQAAESLLRLDLGKLRYETEIPFGDDPIVALAEIDQLQVFNAAGSSSMAPGIFENRIKEILPEIKKTIDGSVESTGLPDGLRRIHLELDIFLPPGIGGTGGGGVITLDNAVMYRYACAGDPLPGAYRHEYGHNMGFGHDPYMMLAEGGSAMDEKLFGSLGYRLLHADTGQRTLDYLMYDLGAQGFSWRPSPAVFTALRTLYGPDVHKKMIEERRASEQTLVLHGLSSIERIATLYSLALERNVAWVFRAHGWPVFDARVDLGGSAVRFVRSHPRQLNYAHVPGTEIPSWWVLDVDGGADPPEWERMVWPTGNIDLAVEGEPIADNRRWLFFRRIVVAESIDARVLCASDVGLEVRVNGQAIGVFDPSPQQFQPAHDELMLDQRRPLPVFLPKGENFIEVAVNQPPGSRGFVLGLATKEGKPLKIGIVDDGPPDEPLSGAKPKQIAMKPVLGGDFETNWRGAWIEGATEPQGALRFTIDERQPARGDSSLRVDLTRGASGAIIQRVFIPAGETYELSAGIRSKDFKGEAFVGLFTGELGGWLGRTEPMTKTNSNWRAVKATWAPGPSRVVYVACYVKGTAGSVWFDEVQLKKK